MADLNRQLQDYLTRSGSQSGSQSQSKGTRTTSQSGSSTTVDLDQAEPDPVPGSWFGRWSRPWTGRPGPGPGPGSGPSSGGPGSWSWPWSGSWSWSWSDPDPCLPMSRSQRVLVLGVLVLLSLLCFSLAGLYAPLLLVYSRKFALLWSLGSLFLLLAAGVLLGPGRLCSGLQNSPGAAWYLVSLCGTLYAALRLHSTALTALGAGLQVSVVLVYLVALLPGGTAGVRLLGGLLKTSIRRSLPV
ncbi:vesicle transport protein SFT2C [Sebastes fasciatus]|uniref:vesicle transport protein SFT2C n=1 Tax=Sebastes fasciatus TaxID=394691 RepID=UPI003D9EE1A4